MSLIKLRNALLEVVDKVYYASNEYDNEDASEPPFIVYQEVTKRPASFAEDKPLYYTSTIQITLVTARKDSALEATLVRKLISKGYAPQSLAEYRNEDGSINKVYEIRQEEFKHG